MTTRLLVRFGAVVCALGIVLGAFGAHSLEKAVEQWYEPDRAALMLDSWETGVRYHLFHGLGLMVIGLMQPLTASPKLLRAAVILILTGLIVFSGGLYIWVLTDFKPLVMAVPVGGVAYIGAWLCLVFCRIPTSQNAHDLKEN